MLVICPKLPDPNVVPGGLNTGWLRALDPSTRVLLVESSSPNPETFTLALGADGRESSVTSRRCNRRDLPDGEAADT